MEKLIAYYTQNSGAYWGYVAQHLLLSLQALVLALCIGLPLGYGVYKKERLRQAAIFFTQGSRVIPSLGVLFVLIPLVGVGRLPALIALILLGIPPVLLNTVVGFSQVPSILSETGRGLGMNRRQLLFRVLFPLALPSILTGVKIALVEIIASASLAAYIGAGGLGTLIITGLGLYRYELIALGGGSVTLLALAVMLLFDFLIGCHAKRLI